MTGSIIKLCYRKIVDASSVTAWDKHVFDDTYKEYYMQAQQFDQTGRYDTFREMLQHVPNADRMHYLVSTAAVGYIRQLNDRIPDVVNVFGKTCVPFTNFRFEIVQSHIKNKTLHTVAIWFYSDPLCLVASVHDRLVFTSAVQAAAIRTGQMVETETLTMPAGLSICAWQQTLPESTTL